jgi:MSHA biogenesis protein MshJ
MKAFWLQQARRINALTLRERAIMFVSLAVAMAAAADALVLSPKMAEQRAMVAELRKQKTELDGLRTQAAGSSAAPGPDTPEGRLQQVRAQRAAVDGELQRRSAVDGAATRLPELLERVLQRHAGLSLLSLATAAPPVVREGEAAAAAQALPLQGVDLSVSGSYPDLARYLADIETALPGVRWSELRVSSQVQPPVMKLRVYLFAES